MSASTSIFKPSDFVRLKQGPAGNVGVVWRLHPKNEASVEVAWRESPTGRIFQSHDPDELVMAVDIPDYAVALKASLFPS